ncbi:hypothetical protein BKA62DRAFT_829264 [Auriculariales sp. MPI-PUGE-AT-0066]|nr:hypothetical protein BKA62DRAFT_829264 [Auriculariales sp. MPI-PUGE-AT-0066]
MSGTRWTQLTLVTASTIRATEAPLGTRDFIISATRQTRQTPISASTIRATEPALRTRVFIIGSVRWTSATRQTRQTPTTASTIGATELSLGTRIFILNLDLGDAADAADANLRVDYSRHSSATWKIGFSSSTADIHRAHSVRWTSATRQTRQTPTTASTIGATELSLGTRDFIVDLGDAADAADVNLRVDHSRHRTST